MPTSLTLKNIPDEVYSQLKSSAEAHRRSLNSEAIVLLEYSLQAARTPPAARIASARALREALPAGDFKARDIQALKLAGRK